MHDDQPVFHLQNVFDALNPLGGGVNDYLKLKCIQIQNRVVGLADSGDIVAISSDCPQEFVDYLLRVVGASDVTALRYSISPDLRKYINARAVFEGLTGTPQWQSVQRRDPLLSPYIQSAATYQVARESGISSFQTSWEAVVNDRITEMMNDKGILHQDCKRLGIPVPKYWLADCRNVIDYVISLLRQGYSRLYIRQTRSAGSLGNVTVERENGRYYLQEMSDHALNHEEFLHLFNRYTSTGYCTEFVVAELLDLYASPGTLFYADDAGVRIVCHSGQVLTGMRRYLGFKYPIDDPKIRVHLPAIEDAVQKLIEPWRRKGYRGYGNIDWMVAKDGRSYVAEINARQTSVVPGLKIASVIAAAGKRVPVITAQPSAILTRDRVYFENPATFESAYSRLHKERLLLGEYSGTEGMIVTIPPAPAFGVNSCGLLALGDTMDRALEIEARALMALGAREERLLLEKRRAA